MKKFSMLMAAALVGMTASAADYYLIGGFNGWALKDANAKFTEVSETEYVLDYVGTLTSGFKVNDGTWGDVDYGSNGSNLAFGEAYVMSKGGGNIAISENVTNPHIVLDPTTFTMTITGQASEAVYTYDIWGNLDGGAAWSSTTLTENNGVWSADVTVSADANFGIRKLSEGSQVDWISSAEGAEVVLNTAMACMVEGTNFSIGAGEYNFSFDPEAMTLTVTGEGGGDEPIDPSEIWGIVGDFNEWGWDGDQKDMTQVAPGVWSYTFNGFQGDFRFAKANSTTNYVGSVNEVTTPLAENGDYNVMAGGKNFRFTETVNGVTVVLDLNNNVMNVTGLPASEDEFPAMYLVGAMTGWGAKDEYKMETTDGVTYTLTCAMEEGGEFKFFGGDWGLREFTYDGTIVAGTYELTSGSQNMIMGVSNDAVKFTLTQSDNFASATLTVAMEGEEPEIEYPATMYVIGDMFTWDIDNPTEMVTEGNGVYSIVVAGPFANETPNFRMVSETGDWETVNQYGARNGQGETGEGNVLVTLGEAGAWNGPAYKGNKDNWQFDVTELAGENLKIIFDMTTMTVSFGKEGLVVGVDTIDAANGEAIYFNLQGARVANPENGLYIRVANGKAQKVVIK